MTERLPAFVGALVEGGIATLTAGSLGFLLYGDPLHVPIGFVLGWVATGAYRRMRTADQIQRDLLILRRMVTR